MIEIPFGLETGLLHAILQYGRHEFVEMIVGVGASQVRDLFAHTRAAARHHIHRRTGRHRSRAWRWMVFNRPTRPAAELFRRSIRMACRKHPTSTSGSSRRRLQDWSMHLRNRVNEAVLLAARRSEDGVHQKNFVDALEKLVLGPPRTLVRSPEERERFAYQEGGHTLCGLLVRGADPVNRVSIIPRGQGPPHAPRLHDRPISIQAAVLRLPA